MLVQGTIFNTFTVGITLYATTDLGIPLLQMLLFSCLIAAVDPVAVSTQILYLCVPYEGETHLGCFDLCWDRWMNKKVRFVLFVKRNDISALNFELVYVVFSHLLLNLICFLEKYLYLFLLFACVLFIWQYVLGSCCLWRSPCERSALYFSVWWITLKWWVLLSVLGLSTSLVRWEIASEMK